MKFRKSKLALCVLLCAFATVTYAQDSPTTRSCTLYASGGTVLPRGDDGTNFTYGWNFQVGGGFAVTGAGTPHRPIPRLYLTSNYFHSRLEATPTALNDAKSKEKSLVNAASAHGAFSAVTFDPTVRFPLSTRADFYLSGGFGWFRRNIGFNGANPASLLNASGASLTRIHSDSGVFDAGGGLDFKPGFLHGLMVYAEVRAYRGAAVNSTSILLPVSGGFRW